ncbi:hypothetical protein [Nocardia sp. NPDC057668]|uniref:hypothetical protein n=1 Tax=Nocardia sp. NPDC057668 TaxID=3346202 RepID=UPI003671ABF6
MTADIADNPAYRSLAEREFDAVVCDPGHFGRAGERRWSTAESAAKWIRHCLGHAESGSLVAVSMPANAAAAPDARILRDTLLRSGVLRAIITGIPASPDLWLLRESDTRSTHVLLIDATGEPSYALRAWRAFEEDPMQPDAEPHAVPIVELLDGEVDLTPRGHHTDPQELYLALHAEIATNPTAAPPVLELGTATPGSVSVEELVEAGTMTVYQAPPTVASAAGLPMLSAKDIRLGRSPSSVGNADVPGAVTIQRGDVAVVIGPESAVRVCADEGVLLGPDIHLVRANAKAVDPRFLAGVLRAAVDAGENGPIDLYQVSVPRISPVEQHRYGQAFEQLLGFEAEANQRQAQIENLVRAGFRGLAHVRLRPADTDK